MGSLTTRDFIQRNIVSISGIVAIVFIIIFVLLSLLITARELQQRTLDAADRTVVDARDLPGPQGRIGKRSEKELEVLLGEVSYVLGGYVLRTQYGKTENPVVFAVSKRPFLEDALRKYGELQAAGRGASSDELAAAAGSLQGSQEAKEGLVKCGRFEGTMLAGMFPELVGRVRGMCLAPVPPFVEGAKLTIVVLLDVDGTGDGPEVKEIRRTLLQLQIDIFNREFQGRETWVHE